VFFVDNSGCDIVLGVLPLIRWMLRHGARVTLGANSGPALNDVLHDELVPLIEHVSTLDAPIRDAWDDGRLFCVATGNELPVIDLTQLDEQFIAHVADADLVVLEGMGRAIETNYDAEFTCPVFRLASLKDAGVAARRGGRMFDCVARFG
jgi:type II pantothenate kinase